MNTNDFDQGTFDNGPRQDVQQPKPRGWWSRNWLWFAPTSLLVLVILCCGCPLGFVYWAFNKVYDLEMFQTAMQRIESDEEIQRALGQPIEIVGWPPPAFRMEERDGRGEADIRWDIEGPNGRAKAHVQARLTDQHWEFVVLEVVLADGKKVSLTGTDDGMDDAPPFEGLEPPTTEPEPEGPAPEINLSVPMDGGPGGS